jgi:hypothetical protein
MNTITSIRAGMDVSNATGSDTDYKVSGSGGTR